MKDNKENEYPIEGEVAKDAEKLKRPLKKWVKVGISLAAIISLLTFGVYWYKKETTVKYSGGGMVDVLPSEICSSTIRLYMGGRVRGSIVKEFIDYINSCNQNMVFDIPLMFYCEGKYYATASEFQELAEKFINNKYYGLRAADEKPFVKDGYYDVIYIGDAYLEETSSSTIKNYIGNRIKGFTVKEFIDYIDECNQKMSFSIPLMIYYEGKYYATVSESQELAEKIVNNEYYGVRAADEKPFVKDGYYDVIYIGESVDYEVWNEIMGTK